MRALLLILIASSALGQGRFDRINKRTDQGRSSRGFLPQSGAFFELAPASGAGMGTACACTAVTGAKGEAVTFTRTGSATCAKQGLATTGIANGDLVSCASNDQPRVEAQSDGVLSLRVEAARTNLAIRSQEINNAAWADSTSGVLGPTITANAGTAPDGTVTAERLVYPATGATQYSVRYQSIPGCDSTTCSYSLYVRGFSGSGTLDLCSWGTAGTPGTGCVTCSYVSTSWTYCSVTHTNTTPSFILFGSDSSGARPTHPSEDVLVWGTQAEAGAFSSSYIPTVAAAATRNAEVPSVAGVSLAGLASSGCVRAYVARRGNASGTAVSFSDSNGRPLYFTPGNQTVFDGLNNPSLATTFNSSAKWYITRWTGSTFTLHNQDTSAANSAFDGTMGVTGPLQIGFSATNLQLDGLISRIQLDPSPTRCTP